jgi:hypothetical protein
MHFRPPSEKTNRLLTTGLASLLYCGAVFADEDAGEYAAAGAVIGAARGAKQRKAQEAQAQPQAQAQNQAIAQERLGMFTKAFFACMEARSYTVR